jgi:hypothetical protein
MMKARKPGVIVLGLSHMNLQKLKEGFPIKFNLKVLNSDKQPNLTPLPEEDVIIFAAKDESAMINMFYNEIGPETEIKD